MAIWAGTGAGEAPPLACTGPAGAGFGAAGCAVGGSVRCGPEAIGDGACASAFSGVAADAVWADFACGAALAVCAGTTGWAVDCADGGTVATCGLGETPGAVEAAACGGAGGGSPPTKKALKPAQADTAPAKV